MRVLLAALITTSQGPCRKGYFCPAGTAKPSQKCAPGWYGSTLGMGDAQCTGACSPGFYCPSGSSSPRERPCGNVTYYCPKQRERVCDRGHYCSSGIKYECPAGTFGNSTGLYTANCTAPCPAGFYCPVGSVEPTECPAGTFGGPIYEQQVVRSTGIGPYTFKLRLSLDAIVANVQAVSLTATEKLTAGTWRLSLALTGSVSVHISEALNFDASADQVRQALAVLRNIAMVDVTRSSQLENKGITDSNTHQHGYTWMITIIPDLDAPGLSGEVDRFVPQWDSDSGVSTCSGCQAFSSAVKFGVEEINAPGNTYSAQNPDMLSYMQPPGHAKVAGKPAHQVDGSTYGASTERPYRPYPRVVSRVGGGWEWADRLQSSGGLRADTAFFGDQTTATEMQRQLNLKLGKGAVGVRRSESLGGYSWTVTFVRHSGDVPLMEVSSHPAAGSVSVYEAVKGEVTHFHGGQGELAMRIAHHSFVPESNRQVWVNSGLSERSCSGLCAHGHYCPPGSSLPEQHKCPAGRYGAMKGLISDACSKECDSSGYCVPTLCPPGHFCPAGTRAATESACGRTRYENVIGAEHYSLLHSWGARFYCPPGSILPYVVSDGYYTTGVDGNPDAAESAATHFGINVMDFDAKRYDTYVDMEAWKSAWQVGALSSVEADTQRPRPPLSRSFKYHSDFDSNGIIYWLGSEGGHGGENLNPEPWRHPLNLFAGERAESRVPFAKVPQGIYISRSSDWIGQPSDLVSQFTVSSDVPTSGQRGNGGIESGTLSEPLLQSPRGHTDPTQMTSGEWDRGGGAWWQIDFGPLRYVQPNYYTLRSGTSNKDDAPLSWRLEGSVSGYEWVILRDHADSTKSLADGQFSTASWEIPPSRRFHQDAASSHGGEGSVGVGWHTADPKGGPYRFLRIIITGETKSGSTKLMLSGFEVYGELYMLQNSSRNSRTGGRGWHLPNPPDIYTRAAQRPCEAGYYCVDGVKTACPPGTFGEIVALRSHNCSGLCPPGFYCPVGSIQPRQRPCGGTAVYCPPGSAKPRSVQRGYYTTGGSISTRSAEVLCPLGSYCIDGIRRECPPGRFGDTLGLWNPKCSGLCAAGHKCRRGSKSRTEEPCPAGSYSTAGSAMCTGRCAAGYFCPRGSVSPTQQECGGDHVFCPAGSSKPQNVPQGFYTTGGTSSTRTRKAECQSSSSPMGEASAYIQQCPSTTQ